MMRARALLLGALVLAGVETVVAAGPANAECIEVTLEVKREAASSWYPLGGSEHCVTDTPWGQSHEIHGGADHGGLPPGTPKGFWIHLWVTTP